MTEILPEEGGSAEIGHRAYDAFLAQKPLNWRCQDLSGGADAGIDAFIQVISGGRFSEGFHAQFKGSTVSAYSHDRDFVSVPLRIATLRYYRRLGFPIMLVFADFSTEPKPSVCPIFYAWIHDKLDEALARAKPDADLHSELTFRIPTANRLGDTLDVTPTLAAQREQRKTVQMLTDAIAGTPEMPTAKIAIEQLATNIGARGASFLESALGQTDAPWAAPEVGTIAWRLKQLDERISAGMLKEAETLFGQIGVARLRDHTEEAEFHLLRGRLHRLVGDRALTLSSFTEANRLAPDRVRYRLSWLEERLVRGLTDGVNIDVLLQEIDDGILRDDPAIRALRARALTILERFDEAKAELDAVPPEKGAVEQVVVLLSRGEFDEAMAYAKTAASLNLGRYALLTLRILGARAHFDKVFHVKLGETSPLGGPPGLERGELTPLWEELRDLAGDLQAAGWPLNSEFIADALTATGVATGRADEALLLVDAFSRARPSDDALQLCRMKLAVFAGQFDVALESAQAIKPSATRVVNTTLIHYQAGAHQRCVAMVPELVALPLDCDPLLPEALAVAAHSAHRLFNLSAHDRCIKRLNEGGFDAQVHVVLAVSASDAGASGRAQAKRQLIEAHGNAPDSPILQDHVVSALDASDATQARELIAVLDKIAQRRQLSPSEYVSLSKALGVLQRPGEAIDALERARVQYPNDDALKASQALLCERYGQTALARRLLAELFGSAKHSEFARSLYINIASRSGLLEEASAQFQALLAEAESPKEKKAALRGLASVEFYRPTPSPNLTVYIREFGKLADRHVEEEEGLFLMMTILAALRLDVEPSESEAAGVRDRINAYITAFPHSNYFGAIPIPQNPSADELKKALEARLGPRFQKDEELETVRRRAQRGLVVIPFVWRPQFVVPIASTIAQLWELAKKSPKQNPLLSFDMDQTQRALRDLRSIQAIPLVDLLSLLVITDLGLWPTLFRFFNRIAISKQTMLQIQGDDGVMSSPSESLQALRTAIRENLDHIDQPGEIDESGRDYQDGGLNETKTLLATGRYILYCDDVAARIYVLGQNEEWQSLHTGHLLRAAEKAHYLGTKAVAHKLAQLVRWHVGFVTVEDRHLIACMPADELGKIPSLSGKINALFGATDYQALISGVWDPPKSGKDTTDHVSRLLAVLLTASPELDDGVLAAVWASWLDKAKLRADVPFGIEEQLALVLVATCFSLKHSERAARKLWNAYIQLVSRHYAERMDEEVERRAHAVVGQVLASGVGGSEKILGRADELLKAVRQGLTADTAPDGHFMKGYTDARIERERTHKRDGI